MNTNYAILDNTDEISVCGIIGILIIKRKFNKGGLILLVEKYSTTKNLIERIMKDLLNYFHCEYQQRN